MLDMRTDSHRFAACQPKRMVPEHLNHLVRNGWKPWVRDGAERGGFLNSVPGETAPCVWGVRPICKAPHPPRMPFVRVVSETCQWCLNLKWEMLYGGVTAKPVVHSWHVARCQPRGGGK